MNKVIIGILVTLIASSVNEYVWRNYDSDTKPHKIAYSLKEKVFEGGYLLDPIMGLCRDRQGQNGFGWKFNVADYYGCDRFQRLLNWNFKKQDPNSPRY